MANTYVEKDEDRELTLAKRVRHERRGHRGSIKIAYTVQSCHLNCIRPIKEAVE
jgi:hypothetical protein